MAKIGNIIDLLEAGAKAEGLRQQAIASNVANLETPGYRRSDIRFEQLLARALESPSGVDLDAIEPELQQPHQYVHLRLLHGLRLHVGRVRNRHLHLQGRHDAGLL